MESKHKKLIVGVIITSSIGLFSWKFYKTAKELQLIAKEEEELYIESDIEELPEMDAHERHIYEMQKIHGQEAVEEAEMLNQIREAKRIRREEVREMQIAILEEQEEYGAVYDEEEEDDDDLYVDEEEEVEKMRHHPNSQAAWDQYVNMRLADIDHSDILVKLRVLFNIRYYPIEDGRDDVLVSNIQSDRISFFGEESVYLTSMSMAEVFLHYARLLDFDLGDGIEMWAWRLLDNVDFIVGNSLGQRKMQDTVDSLMVHQYYNPKKDHSFGIFALNDGMTPIEELEQMNFMDQYWKFLEGEMD